MYREDLADGVAGHLRSPLRIDGRKTEQPGIQHEVGHVNEGAARDEARREQQPDRGPAMIDAVKPPSFAITFPVGSSTTISSDWLAHDPDVVILVDEESVRAIDAVRQYCRRARTAVGHRDRDHRIIAGVGDQQCGAGTVEGEGHWRQRAACQWSSAGGLVSHSVATPPVFPVRQIVPLNESEMYTLPLLSRSQRVQARSVADVGKHGRRAAMWIDLEHLSGAENRAPADRKWSD